MTSGKFDDQRIRIGVIVLKAIDLEYRQLLQGARRGFIAVRPLEKRLANMVVST